MTEGVMGLAFVVWELVEPWKLLTSALDAYNLGKSPLPRLPQPSTTSRPIQDSYLLHCYSLLINVSARVSQRETRPLSPSTPVSTCLLRPPSLESGLCFDSARSSLSDTEGDYLFFTRH